METPSSLGSLDEKKEFQNSQVEGSQVEAEKAKEPVILEPLKKSLWWLEVLNMDAYLNSPNVSDKFSGSPGPRVAGFSVKLMRILSTEGFFVQVKFKFEAPVSLQYVVDLMNGSFIADKEEVQRIHKVDEIRVRVVHAGCMSYLEKMNPKGFETIVEVICGEV